MPENINDLKLNNVSNGNVCFAPDVLATIAGLAITEVEGIANTVHFSGLLAEKLTRRTTNNIKNITRGVKVEVKDGKVCVNITVVVEYGYSVPEVSKNIQENVKKTIETMTGMEVESVDVHVSGLSFAKENKEAAELEYKRFMLDTETEDENKQLDSEETAAKAEDAEA